MAETVIETRELSKHFAVWQRREDGSRAAFGRRRTRELVVALDGVSFVVGRGEIVGYIGPNGAGKSTTVKLLTGILAPTGGEVSVLGLSPSRQRIRLVNSIGVMFGQRSQLWWDLPVMDSFRALARIYGVSGADLGPRLARFDAVLGIRSLLGRPVRSLSLGQRVRCELAAALLHNPSLVFLDEPTIGLDVDVKERVRRFLRDLSRVDGLTVFLTTHDLGDIQELCARVLVIDRGRISYDGALDSLVGRLGGWREIVFTLREEPCPDDLRSAAAAVRGEWVIDGIDAHSVRMRVKIGVPLAPLIEFMADRYHLSDLAVKEPSVETVVRSVYRGEATL